MPVVATPTVLQAATALYDSIGGGLPQLWLNEVPEGGTAAGYPRAILEDGGEVAGDEVNADGTLTTVLRSFRIRLITENDSDSAETLALLVLAAFTPTALLLTFDSNAVLEHDKRTWTTFGRLERSPADKPLYESAITYVCRHGTTY